MPHSTSETLKLKKIGRKWKFQSEAHLEDFFWSALTELLNVTPLKRQFGVNGQFCDILAIENDRRLVIIELKNDEDRYIVSQITRYYHALLKVKPLTEFIDYTKPVRLLAIAPGFHRDNEIDRQYNRLPIEFLQFAILVESGKLTFTLKDIEEGTSKAITVPFNEETEAQQKQKLPEPPRRLLKLLADVSEIDRQAILTVREQILSYHDRIKELSVGGSFLYGSGKTKACAELKYDKTRQTIALFLWLPHIASRYRGAKIIVARMRIWTDWLEVKALGHVPKGNGRMISFEEWESASVRPLKKLLPRSSVNKNSIEKYFTNSPIESNLSSKEFGLICIPVPITNRDWHYL